MAYKRKEKTSFVVYHDIRRPLELLTMEQIGEMFMAMIDYSENGIMPEFQDPAMAMCFAFTRNTMDRDNDAWEETRVARVEAGRKGGQQTIANRANANFANQHQQTIAYQANADNADLNQNMETNQAVTVPDTVTVPVMEAEKHSRKKRQQVPFIAPTVEEIAAFCIERGNGLDPQKIFDYYSAGDWKDMNGKKIRSWKQKIVGVWEQGQQDKPKKGETIDLSWRMKESVNPDDMVEFPAGSGHYRPRWEIGTDG